MKVASSSNRPKTSSETEFRGTSASWLDIVGSRSPRLLHFSQSRLEVDHPWLFLGGAWLRVEGAVVRLLQLGLEVQWWWACVHWRICDWAWHHFFKWGLEDSGVVRLLQGVGIRLVHRT